MILMNNNSSNVISIILLKQKPIYQNEEKNPYFLSIFIGFV